jgi:hypothetical protein
MVVIRRWSYEQWSKCGDEVKWVPYYSFIYQFGSKDEAFKKMNGILIRNNSHKKLRVVRITCKMEVIPT